MESDLWRSVAALAADRMASDTRSFWNWTSADAAFVRQAGVGLAADTRDAARFIADGAQALVDGIDLSSPLGPGSPLGPRWHGHPLGSAAMNATYRLREPDVTRGLERLMSAEHGTRGTTRAVSFLRALAAAGRDGRLQDALLDGVRLSVVSEHPIRVSGRPRRSMGVAGSLGDETPAPGRNAPARLDMLFSWPLADGVRFHVVVVEAKLGSTVSAGQLAPYRQEARRLSRGGPVSCFLLTLRPDRAERRYASWCAVRWRPVLAHWERALAVDGDDDEEFRRLRAQIWRHVLPQTRSH